jgi:hypothetical protein
MNWRRVLIWLVSIVAGLFLVLLGYLYFAQERIIFLPRSAINQTPADIGLNAENVTLTIDDEVTLHGWYFPVDSTRPTVLFCHGNAGNISNRLETAQFLVSTMHVNLMLFDYRGYGQSTGEPSEEGIYTDARTFRNWLTTEQKIPLNKIVLFGRSLGGAVAVQMATEYDCRGLIVESSFTSIPEMAAAIYPWLPARYLARIKMASIDKIGRVKFPILITHSPNDDLIPYWMGEKLYEASSAPKRFGKLNGRHNELDHYHSPEYRAQLEWIFTGSGEN